jgi:hypothetical protein
VLNSTVFDDQINYLSSQSHSGYNDFPYFNSSPSQSVSQGNGLLQKAMIHAEWFSPSTTLFSVSFIILSFTLIANLFHSKKLSWMILLDYILNLSAEYPSFLYDLLCKYSPKATKVDSFALNHTIHPIDI